MDTKRILAELQTERTRIDEAIRALEAISSDGATRSATRASATRRPKKRHMTAAGRKRLSELLKKRWAQGKMGKRRRAKAAS